MRVGANFLTLVVWLVQVKVPVCVFAFDCLYVDGQSLLKWPLQERRERLAVALPNLRPGFICLAHSHVLHAPADPPPAPPISEESSADAANAAPQERASQQAVVPPATPERSVDRPPSDMAAAAADGRSDDDAMRGGGDAVMCVADAADGAAAGGAEGELPRAAAAAEADTEALIREHLQDALAAGTEGLMLKALSGTTSFYQPSKRSNSWLKIKRSALNSTHLQDASLPHVNAAYLKRKRLLCCVLLLSTCHTWQDASRATVHDHLGLQNMR